MLQHETQSWNNILENALLLGDFEGAVHMARKRKTLVTSRQEYAICLCVEIQALFELGKEKEARDIAMGCVARDGIAFENFSLLNTCVSLFLVESDGDGVELAEKTLQRWCQMERRVHQSQGGIVRFSIEQEKHLWLVLLFHVFPQRGLEGIEKGLDIVTKELPEWEFDTDWLDCVKRELLYRKEVLEKESRVVSSSEQNVGSPVYNTLSQENSATTTSGRRRSVVGVEQDENLWIDVNTERNESVLSKTWKLVQQVDSPMLRISVITAFCLLFYSFKRKFRVNRQTTISSRHRPWSQALMDILKMAFGLSYGRPGI